MAIIDQTSTSWRTPLTTCDGRLTPSKDVNGGKGQGHSPGHGLAAQASSCAGTRVSVP